MQYQVDVELAGPELSAAEAERAMDALPHLSAAIGWNGGHSDVIITVNADDVVQAGVVGVAAIERATGRTVAVLAVVPTKMWDERQDFLPVPELVGASEAAEILGVTRQRIAQLVEEGKVPAQRAGSALVFARSTIEAIARTRAGRN